MSVRLSRKHIKEKCSSIRSSDRALYDRLAQLIEFIGAQKSNSGYVTLNLEDIGLILNIPLVNPDDDSNFE